MKTIHINALFILVTAASLALTGTVSLAGQKWKRHYVFQELPERTGISDGMGFLTRYYNEGASAGSTWESLVYER